MDKKEIIERLREEDPAELFKEADNIRRIFCGAEVHIRGLIEFSNYCCRSCLYCGLRRENWNILRYRMSPDEIVELAREIVQYGVKTIVLQSGDDFEYSQKILCGIIGKIKEQNPEIAITLSIGERPLDDYKALKDAGADRYLLKHETASHKLYERLHTGQTLKKRLEILEYLKKIGYQVGAGNIVGLPGQTLSDLADDILLLKDMDVDMAGIGPFISHPDTPLAKEKGGTLDLVLRVLAIARIVLKNVHLPATTAVGTIDPLGREKALEVGANVVMPIVTPKRYRPLYQIYPDRICIEQNAQDCLNCIKRRIESCGRKISLDRGDSPKWKKHQKAYAYI